MEFAEIIWVVIYFTLLILGSVIFSMIRYKDKVTRRRFVLGLTLKLIGAILICGVYLFFYGGGDTYSYYQNSVRFKKFLLSDPSNAWQLIQSSSSSCAPEVYHYMTQFIYWKPASYAIIKITGVISLINISDSFFVSAMLLSTVSFLGLWGMYRALSHHKPQYSLLVFLSIFCVPTVFFWSSGILKDNVCIGCLGFILWGVYNVFFKKRWIIVSIGAIALCASIVLLIKAYMLYAFLPFLLFWWIFHIKSAIPSRALRQMLGPLFLLVAFGLGVIGLQQLGQQSERFRLENMQEVAYKTQDWHSRRAEMLDESSHYSLGDMGDFSPIGLLRKVPAAINVTFFRPYIFETHNFVMLLAAIESSILLLFTILLLAKTKIIGLLRIVLNDSFILFVFGFALLFGFSVGLTSYNFGALVRYKAPCMPFFVLGLLVCFAKLKDNNSISERSLSAN